MTHPDMMTASKEDARKALDLYDQLPLDKSSWDVLTVRDFLEAAIKRLPTKSAINRNRKRKRATTK